MPPKVRNITNLSTFSNSINKGSNKKLILAVLLIFIALGVLYMLIANRNMNAEGFEADVSYHQGEVNWNKDKDILVVFSKMEGCGHCVRLVPEWLKASAKMHNKSTKNGKTCKMVVVDPSHKLSKGVTGYPTIKKYVGNNQGVEFNDSRTAENLVKFCMDA
jgi:hypothetical protein